MNKIQLSVAMCTYNGATFLEEQLNSIATQTRLPDELIVCDDASTDETCQILEKFAQRAPFAVEIHRNRQSLQVTKNFEKALHLCKGDILFLCDQDDLWRSDKVEKMVGVFEANPNAQVVYSDAELINERAELIGQRQWDILRLYPTQLKQWKSGLATDLMLGGNRVTGCMVAVRKQFVEKLMPFPTAISGCIHDGWIGFVGSVLDVIQLCEEPLTMYRQHENQQIGIRTNEDVEPVSLKQRFSRPQAEKVAPIREKHEQLMALYQETKTVVPHNHPNLLKIARKLQFLEMRGHLPDQRLFRIMPVLKHLTNGNYHHYADQDANWMGGFLTALGDFME